MRKEQQRAPKVAEKKRLKDEEEIKAFDRRWAREQEQEKRKAEKANEKAAKEARKKAK